MFELTNFTREELGEYLQSIGLQPYKVKQIFQWVYQKGVFDFNYMSNISKQDRKLLESKFNINIPKIIKTTKSVDGTEKFTSHFATNLRG